MSFELFITWQCLSSQQVGPGEFQAFGFVDRDNPIQLRSLPFRNVPDSAQLPPGAPLAIFGRNYSGEWLEIIYVRPTDEILRGWLPADKVFRIEKDGKAVTIQNLPVCGNLTSN